MSDPAAALRARSPWHEGEQELQRRLGVRERMEAVGRRVLVEPDLAAGRYLSEEP